MIPWSAMDASGEWIIYWTRVQPLLTPCAGGSESPTGFLEREVFVVLLPGLEETLKTAKSTEVQDTLLVKTKCVVVDCV